jgi:hypothetical protein
MKLTDIAGEIVREAESARREAEKKEAIAAARSRRVSYFKEFGDQWFSELAKHVEALAESFNEIAGEQAKLTAQLNPGPDSFWITIAFEQPNRLLDENCPRCSIKQQRDDLKVAVDMFDGPRASNLQCDVRIPDFKEFGVQVVLKHEKSVIDEVATDKYCDVDDESFFPIFKTVRSEETKKFNTSEFAEFVLAEFISFSRRKRRA